jgi:uncharacterized membrane protein YccC
MTEASRLSTTAGALRDALDVLADALSQVRPEAMAASETTIEACVREFRDAAAASVTSRDVLPPEQAMALDAALRRCRRLGASLSLLAGPRTPPPDSPHGYTPVGKPVPRGGEGSFLTARV